MSTDRAPINADGSMLGPLLCQKSAAERSRYQPGPRAASRLLYGPVERMNNGAG
jgi:hypothetical protein